MTRVPLSEERMRIDPDGGAHLLGMKCDDCEQIIFPKSTLCPNCGSTAVEEIPLSDRGKVWTYTVVHVSYGSVVAQPPYVAAFVELEGGGFVHTPIIECDPEEIDIGTEVELEIVKAFEEGDVEKVVYVFKPVSGQ